MAGNVLLRTAGNRAQDADMASKIVNSGARMAQIISDLLVFSRTRLGNQLPVKLEDVNLSRVVEGVVNELRTLYPARDISVREQGELDGRWDGGRLSQMVSNLLVNALQYGSPTGPVGLSLRGTEREVEVSVHNVGDPIAPSRLKQVFDPLVRGPSSRGTASSPDNLGLGLYIVRAIAEAHGGSASVKSSLAEGTTFTVLLPRDGAPK
jgi:signal transduction histidine kinase